MFIYGTGISTQLCMYMCIYKHILHNGGSSQPYMASFAVKRNVTKFKDALLNYNCIKLTAMHIIFCQKNFAAMSCCPCSELECYQFNS